MRYAVLFKIYFLDQFVIRQLERLKDRIGAGDLFVLVDDTNGTVGEVPHDRVLRLTEQDMIVRGFAKNDPSRSLFWLCTDYPLYRFFEDEAAYDVYVTVEYDAVINGDLDSLVAAVAASGADFVAQPILASPAEWYWTPTCDKIYDLASIRPYLESVAFFSNRAVALLRDRRLALSKEFIEGQISQFPLAEAFLATELGLAGFTLAKLSDFGGTEFYDWWPPINEADLHAIDSTFLHPVLAGERYIDSLMRDDGLKHLFSPNPFLRRRFLKLNPRAYLPRLFLKLDSQNHGTAQHLSLEKLQDALFDEPEPSANIALLKPASQSSISALSHHQDVKLDAAGAVNGLVTGTFAFHTAADFPAWWMVDLQQEYKIDEIWIFNCLDLHSSDQHINVFVSKNRRIWEQVLVRKSVESFGGAFGRPLTIKLGGQIVARYIRIELAEKDSLHLDQVKVFGQPAHEQRADG